MVLQLILYSGTDLQLENNFSVPEAVCYCTELLPKMAIGAAAASVLFRPGCIVTRSMNVADWRIILDSHDQQERHVCPYLHTYHEFGFCLTFSSQTLVKLHINETTAIIQLSYGCTLG